MIYVQATQMTFLQKAIFVLLLIAFLAGAFFLTMALLPVILLLLAYLWYKNYTIAKQIRNAQENIFNAAEHGDFSHFNENFLHTKQESAPSHGENDIYDISPDDYSVEDKK